MKDEGTDEIRKCIYEWQSTGERRGEGETGRERR